MLKIVLTFVAALLVATAPACGEEVPRRGGTLAFAVNANDPPTYDCHASNLFTIVHLLSPHYSTLLKIDPADYPKVMGDAAESWTVSPEATSYTFHLRPNIRFHDGTALTAEDVRVTYERIRNPPPGVTSVRQGLLADVAAIETPDSATIVFKLKQANRGILYAFALPFNCLYSAALLKSDPDYPAKKVMGSGPFRFVKHDAGSSWSGARFDGYFKPGLPYLDGFEALFLQGAALINAIQGGQVLGDFRGITPLDKNRLVAAMGDKITIQESPWSNALSIVFNTEKKPLDDVRVRRALSLAIDRWRASEAMSRQAILRSVGGVLRPGYALAAREDDLVRMPGFSHDIAASRQEARRLLKEAGAENLRLQLLNRTIANLFTPTGIFLIDQWRQIGVEVEHVQVTDPVFNAALAAGNFSIALDPQGDPIDEPDFQLARYLSSDIAPANRSRFIDRDLDQLFDRQRLLVDPTQRYAAIRAFERRLFEEAPVVPFLWWHRIVALSPRIKGWHMSPSHLINQDLETVWLAEP